MMMTPTPTDIYYMNLAIAQAQQGIYSTRPNPSVGCVLVKDEQIIGEGFTSPAGGNHAEINALVNAKLKANASGFADKIQGATAYVTLEPCSHYGRTPPCANALIEADIGRVVIAGLDPNPQVAGRGVAMLQEANVEVTTGVLTEQAEQVNKGFLKAMRTGKPYVRLKIATSLDGRTALSTGESKWITGAIAREDVQKLRAMSGAIITGSQTVIDDNPSLNVRSTALGTELALIPQPKPIILDRRKRLNKTSDYTLCQNKETLFWRHADLTKLLTTLVSDYQCYDVLVEAGAKVAGAFIEQGLVDELIVYQAPCLLGTASRPMLDFQIHRLADQHRLQLVSHEKVGADVKLVFNTL